VFDDRFASGLLGLRAERFIEQWLGLTGVRRRGFVVDTEGPDERKMEPSLSSIAIGWGFEASGFEGVGA